MSVSRVKSPSTLSKAAVVQLRRAIVSGKLRPGSLLKDAELAARLGLSATPVREALVELVGEGLVEMQPNRSKRVAPIELKAIVELLDVQMSLWALGYAWGVQHMGPAEHKRLRAAHASHAKALERGDIAAAIAGAFAFHRVFMEASGNRELLRVALDRLPLIERFILLCAPWMVSPRGLAGHEAILGALEKRDTKEVIREFKETGDILMHAARGLREDEIAHEYRR